MSFIRFLGMIQFFQKLYNWWKLYHLNDLHAGTPEQEQALASVGLLGVNKYTQACEYLKSVWLYEVVHDSRGRNVQIWTRLDLLSYP